MKIGRLFLDVRGTMTRKDYYIYEDEVMRSRALIQQLIIKDELDELRLSIVSSDSVEEVEEYARTLQRNLSGIGRLHFGHHHAECKMMHIGGQIRDDKDNKAEQMVDNLRICDHKICYYADDCKVNRMMAKRYISQLFPELKLVIFNPNNDGLRGLNNAVTRYVNDENF